MKPIATRLHQLLERVQRRNPLLEHMATLPHYVVDRPLVAWFQVADLDQPIAALVTAGKARLSYPQMVVEFDIPKDGYDQAQLRVLARISEVDGMFKVDVVIAVEGGPMTITAQPIEVRPSLTPDPGLDVADAPNLTEQAAGSFATVMALLIRVTPGISSETIDPVQLNKARARGTKRRPRIPVHTLLRLDRKGT